MMISIRIDEILSIMRLGVGEWIAIHLGTAEKDVVFYCLYRRRVRGSVMDVCRISLGRRLQWKKKNFVVLVPLVEKKTACVLS